MPSRILTFYVPVDDGEMQVNVSADRIIAIEGDSTDAEYCIVLEHDIRYYVKSDVGEAIRNYWESNYPNLVLP